MLNKQTPWEETAEEARSRVRQSKSTKTEWLGTVVGLVLAAGTLAFLLFNR